jgi:sugar (pentulose or hexulose) kinase
LRLAGGGSTNPAWRQLLADVLGYPLRAVDVPAASARGAALLAARAAGLIDEPSLLENLAQATTVVAEPRADRHAYFTDRHHTFVRTVQALRTDSDSIPAVPM